MTGTDDHREPPTRHRLRHDDREALNLFLGYRVLVAMVMVVLFFAVRRGPLGTHSPDLFAATALLYSVLAVGALMFGLARPTRSARQAALAVLADIACFTVLTHASGGVASGLGLLIGISLTLGATLLPTRAALALAAAASLAILGEEFWADLHDTFPSTSYVRAGFLGIAYFVLVGLSLNLTARARRSEELAEQRETELVSLARLSDFVIQQMQSGVVVVDPQGEVQLINESAWALLGMPTQMRHHPLEAVSPPLAGAWRAWQRQPERAILRLRAGEDGRDLRVQFHRLGRGGGAGTLLVLEDVSRLTQQAQQLKLASLGRLTAGIAHEVRNPLGAISHAAQLLAESPDLPEADRRLTEIIRQNSERVNEVIESILKLSRQDLPHPKPLVLGPWLQQIVVNLRQACDLDESQLRCHIEPEHTTVYADEGQLKQVLEVLCDNAVRHFEAPRERLRVLIVGGITRLSHGPYLEVQDNGPGISPEAVDKLFEPFFTTHNQGSGLGLYIARQLCEANRIRLEYRPLPGGTCFRLTFPSPRRRELK